MPVPTHVARRLREVLGADAGGDLVSWMDDTSTIRADVAEVRADVAELRHEMQVGFARMEANTAAQIATLRQTLGDEIARTRADLMKWSFVFWVGAVAAIAALAGVLRP